MWLRSDTTKQQTCERTSCQPTKFFQYRVLNSSPFFALADRSPCVPIIKASFRRSQESVELCLFPTSCSNSVTARFCSSVFVVSPAHMAITQLCSNEPATTTVGEKTAGFTQHHSFTSHAPVSFRQDAHCRRSTSSVHEQSFIMMDRRRAPWVCEFLSRISSLFKHQLSRRCRFLQHSSSKRCVSSAGNASASAETAAT